MHTRKKARLMFGDGSPTLFSANNSLGNHHLHNFPEEMLVYIFSFLITKEQLANVAAVCRRFHTAAKKVPLTKYLFDYQSPTIINIQPFKQVDVTAIIKLSINKLMAACNNMLVIINFRPENTQQKIEYETLNIRNGKTIDRRRLKFTLKHLIKLSTTEVAFATVHRGESVCTRIHILNYHTGLIINEITLPFWLDTQIRLSDNEIACSSKNVIHILNIRTGNITQTLTPTGDESGSINCMSTLAGSDAQPHLLVAGDCLGNVSIWDYRANQRLNYFRPALYPHPRRLGHTYYDDFGMQCITALTNETFAIGSQNGIVYIVNYVNGHINCESFMCGNREVVSIIKLSDTKIACGHVNSGHFRLPQDKISIFDYQSLRWVTTFDTTQVDQLLHLSDNEMASTSSYSGFYSNGGEIFIWSFPVGRQEPTTSNINPIKQVN